MAVLTGFISRNGSGIRVRATVSAQCQTPNEVVPGIKV